MLRLIWLSLSINLNLPFWELSFSTVLFSFVCKEPLTSCFLASFGDKTPNASSSNSLVPSNFIEDGRTRNSPFWKNSKNHETNKNKKWKIHSSKLLEQKCLKTLGSLNPKDKMSVNHDIDVVTYTYSTLSIPATVYYRVKTLGDGQRRNELKKTLTLVILLPM